MGDFKVSPLIYHLPLDSFLTAMALKGNRKKIFFNNQVYLPETNSPLILKIFRHKAPFWDLMQTKKGRLPQISSLPLGGGSSVMKSS